MAFVANHCRPLTKTPEEALAVMREIEAAGGLPFTCIVNNANLAHETDIHTVLDALPYMKRLSGLSGLPVCRRSILTSPSRRIRRRRDRCSDEMRGDRYALRPRVLHPAG